MPTLEPRQIQQELKKKELWSVYWLFGREEMKSRELYKRIMDTLGSSSMNIEKLNGAETSGEEILNSAQTLSFGGGTRTLLIRNAHQIKDLEKIEPLLEPKKKLKETYCVCIFLSPKELDKRKKFSKTLAEKAALVPCEEVPEQDREAWIGYLAKRNKLSLSQEDMVYLRSLEPWNLDIIDSELEKISLAGEDARAEYFRGGHYRAEKFIHFLFSREKKKSLELIESFANKPEEAIPLVGLINWNLRQLLLMKARSSGGKKMNPYFQQRFSRWAGKWELEDLTRLQSNLARLDFQTKQTRLLPLSQWSELLKSL